MKTKLTIICFFLSMFLFHQCHEDESFWGNDDFVVAFKNPSENMGSATNELKVQLVFSQSAIADGWIEIGFDSQNMDYGESADFITVPAAENGKIRLPIQKGQSEVDLWVYKLNEVVPGDSKTIEFIIQQVEMAGKTAYAQGNKTNLVSFSEAASLGGTLSPLLGGPNQPNQVYVELRTKGETVVRRDTWDLAFYSGNEFRVKLNGALFMAAAKLNSTNIDQVSMAEIEDLKPKMKFLNAGSNLYVDDPSGVIQQTAIQEISVDDSANSVYLIDLGSEIGTDVPEVGGVAISGAHRGYKKIRILRQEESYVLQYADLSESTHHEIVIPKSEGFNFTFFHFNTHSIVNVEPQSTHWDLNFTVKTDVIEFPGLGFTAYSYSDFVESNRLGGVKTYRVYTDEISYDAFGYQHIEESKFTTDTRTIGASWRKVTPPNKYLYDNIFYIVKDSEGNYYKLKFTAYENQNGVRGYPQFKYSLLK